MTSWVEWHDDYDRPGSSLARRLEVVKGHFQTALNAVGPSPTILSLCSGDGRDVIGVLTGRPAKVGRAVLIERDQELTDRANRAAAAAGLSEIEVRCRDAGLVESFVDALPVDVLLLCGIFGNIDHGNVKRMVEFVPSLVSAGGYVLWTRGGSTPDRRPEIRKWFVEVGLEEVAFDGAPEPYGVGLNRLNGPSGSCRHLPERLFRFQ